MVATVSDFSFHYFVNHSHTFFPISANPNTQNDSQTELFSLSSFLIDKNFLIGFLFLPLAVNTPLG